MFQACWMISDLATVGVMVVLRVRYTDGIRNPLKEKVIPTVEEW